MHYFADPIFPRKTQRADALAPSDTQLRNFATEHFARDLREQQIPDKDRNARVRAREQLFWQSSGMALWELVGGGVPIFEEPAFYKAFQRSFENDFVRDFNTRYSQEAS